MNVPDVKNPSRNASDLTNRSRNAYEIDNMHQSVPDKEHTSHRQRNNATVWQKNEDFSDINVSRTSQLKYSFYSPKGTKVTGNAFKVDLDLLRSLWEPIRHSVKVSRLNMVNFTFVMGVSSSHFQESRDAVASVQHHFRHKKILYYDWELNPSQRKTVQSWCQVDLRPFNFSLYPSLADLPKVKLIRFQAAKVFAILNALIEYPAVFWMDASTRLTSGDLDLAYQMALKNSGLVFFSTALSYISTFSLTPPATFSYLPSDPHFMQTILHVQSGAFFLLRSHKILTKVLWWFTLCTLDRSCLLNNTEIICDFQRSRLKPDKTVYQNCTRADQSVLNILAANLYQFDVQAYCIRNQTILEVHTQPTPLYKEMIC